MSPALGLRSVISFRSAKLSRVGSSCSGKNRKEWVAKESQESQDLRDDTSDLPEKRDAVGFLESAHASPDLPYCTIPMFGHAGSERLASPFLRREQTVPYFIRRPMRSVDRSSEFLLCDVADDPSWSQSLDRTDPKTSRHKCIIQYTKHTPLAFMAF